SLRSIWRLTVKLRGRPEAPDQAPRAHNLSRARGADMQAVHGPLQRLLDAMVFRNLALRDRASRGRIAALEPGVRQPDVMPRCQVQQKAVGKLGCIYKRWPTKLRARVTRGEL